MLFLAVHIVSSRNCPVWGPCRPCLVVTKLLLPIQSNPDIKTKTKQQQKYKQECLEYPKVAYVYVRIFFLPFFFFANTLFHSVPFEICDAFSSVVFKGFLNRSLMQVVVIASPSP